MARQDDGSYLVGTYHEIEALLHDPRISSDGRNRIPPERIETEDLPPSFISLDDPEHDRLRRIAMRPFGPPHTPGRIDSLAGEMAGVAGNCSPVSRAGTSSTSSTTSPIRCRSP